MPTRAPGHSKREKLRNQFWPEADFWNGEKEIGWFSAPRTLPLILRLLDEKQVSGSLKPSGVYLELLARHISGGVVEMVHEGDHAYTAGYSGNRSVRTWQERMRILEEMGFIKTKRIGDHYKFVLLVHPTTVVQRLREAKKVPDQWWDAYYTRQTETREPTYEDRESPSSNVVQMSDSKKRA